MFCACNSVAKHWKRTDFRVGGGNTFAKGKRVLELLPFCECKTKLEGSSQWLKKYIFLFKCSSVSFQENGQHLKRKVFFMKMLSQTWWPADPSKRPSLRWNESQVTTYGMNTDELGRTVTQSDLVFCGLNYLYLGQFIQYYCIRKKLMHNSGPRFANGNFVHQTPRLLFP